MGNRRFCFGSLEEGNEFPIDASSPKVSSSVEFPSAEPLHTGRVGTGDQIVRLKNKNQGSAVSACSYAPSQDEGKDSGHMPICPVASLQH